MNNDLFYNTSPPCREETEPDSDVKCGAHIIALNLLYDFASSRNSSIRGQSCMNADLWLKSRKGTKTDICLLDSDLYPSGCGLNRKALINELIFFFSEFYHYAPATGSHWEKKKQKNKPGFHCSVA